jgi:radical SAM protein with 4Fe4S-binding SPASM domain
MANIANLGVGTVLKNFIRVARYPRIAARLLAFEAEKSLLNLVGPVSCSGRARKIRVLALRPTDRCNLRCHICGQWGDQGYQFKKDIKEFKSQELPVNRYRFLLEDLVRCGHHPIVVLLGGEPMLYGGIAELIESAASLGLPTMMTTNGTHLSAAAERLVKAPLFALQLSIDGHCAELHNALRPGLGNIDNFAQIEAALRAVRHARQACGSNLPLITAITAISRENSGNLVDIYETFHNDVDLFVFCLSWWIDPPRAIAHEKDFYNRFGTMATRQWGYVNAHRPESFEALNGQLQELLRRSHHWNAKPVSIIPPIVGAGNLEAYYTRHSFQFGYRRCVSIFQEVQVTSNGEVRPCRSYADYQVGNVREATITELWNAPAYRDFRRSLTNEGLMPACTRCCGLMGC